MKKFLIIVLLLGVLAWAALGGYYFFVVKPGKPLSVTALLPKTASTAWTDVRGQIARACREVPVATAQESAYISRLADAIGGVTFDAAANAFSAVDDAGQVSIQPVAKNNGIPDPNASNCWTVWVGNLNGNGKVAYEKTDGKIATLDVTGFPIPPTPTPPPGE